MSAKLPLALLSQYAKIGINFYFLKHEGEPPPSDLDVFRVSAESAGTKARDAGELDELRAVIDALLGNGELYLEEKFDLTLAELVNPENSQPEEYLREVLAYYRRVIWPDAPPIRPGQPPDIELVLTPLADWRREQASKGA